MAVNYNTLLNKIKSDPLNKTELSYIKEMENHIDEIILKDFDRVQNIYIEIPYVNFNYSPKNKKPIDDVTNTRRRLMREELESRYRKEGWVFEDQFGDIDEDYYIIKPKGKK